VLLCKRRVSHKGYLLFFPRSTFPAVNESRCDRSSFFAICLSVCLFVYIYPRRAYAAHSTHLPHAVLAWSTCILSEITWRALWWWGTKILSLRWHGLLSTRSLAGVTARH